MYNLKIYSMCNILFYFNVSLVYLEFLQCATTTLSMGGCSYVGDLDKEKPG